MKKTLFAILFGCLLAVLFCVSKDGVIQAAAAEAEFYTTVEILDEPDGILRDSSSYDGAALYTDLALCTNSDFV